MKTLNLNHEVNEVLNSVPLQTKPVRETYNGWKNYQTWNVALWINNDEPIYRAAVAYMNRSKRPTYLGFVNSCGLRGDFTPDRIKWDGSRLDYKALNKMMEELVS